MRGKPCILSFFPNSLKHEHSCKILYIIHVLTLWLVYRLMLISILFNYKIIKIDAIKIDTLNLINGL